MANTQRARTAARWSRPTSYRARRRRLLLGVTLILILANPAGQLLNDMGQVRMPTARTRIDDRRTVVSAVSWPQQGQAALALGDGQPAASPREQPVPIASVAKVMTAYLVLKRYPLSGAQDGFTLMITEAQAQDEIQDRAEGQSMVAVEAGKQLTERQLLEARLIPSGNNIARILATQVAGNETSSSTRSPPGKAQARSLRPAQTLAPGPPTPAANHSPSENT